MDKNGVITISNPQKGIANSAILGNEAIIGCEIFEEPGTIKIASALEADSSPVNDPNYVTLTGFPIADVTNNYTGSSTHRTVVTSTGQIFSGPNANFLLSTQSFGWDACVWNSEFTIVSYSSGGVGYIGAIYHDSFGGVSWFGARIGGLDSTHYIKLLKGQDNYMYYTNGNTIGRITNIVNVAGVVTATYSSNVLDLPDGVYGVSLAELGSNLLIGTQQGPSYGFGNAFSSANIYPWDRTSSSFRLPVQINENGINAMISHRNQVYFSAGDDGRIYTTDGTNYQLVKRLPFTTMGTVSNPTSFVYPNAMCINQKGNLLVGLSANYDANAPTTTGIWEIQLSQGYPTHLPFFSRDGNLGQIANVRFGSVRTLNANALSFGIQSGSTYELSTTSSTALWSGYKARWRTEAFFVGNARDKKAFEQLEFLLSKPLIANQGIKISYRKNLQDDFTEIDTWDYSDLGGVISHFAPAEIVDAEILQFEIALDYTSSIFGNNVNLLRIMIY